MHEHPCHYSLDLVLWNCLRSLLPVLQNEYAYGASPLGLINKSCGLPVITRGKFPWGTHPLASRVLPSTCFYMDDANSIVPICKNCIYSNSKPTSKHHPVRKSTRPPKSAASHVACMPPQHQNSSYFQVQLRPQHSCSVLGPLWLFGTTPAEASTLTDTLAAIRAAALIPRFPLKGSRATFKKQFTIYASARQARRNLVPAQHGLSSRNTPWLIQVQCPSRIYCCMRCQPAQQELIPQAMHARQAAAPCPQCASNTTHILRTTDPYICTAQRPSQACHYAAMSCQIETPLLPEALERGQCKSMQLIPEHQQFMPQLQHAVPCQRMCATQFVLSWCHKYGRSAPRQTLATLPNGKGTTWRGGMCARAAAACRQLPPSPGISLASHSCGGTSVLVCGTTCCMPKHRWQRASRRRTRGCLIRRIRDKHRPNTGNQQTVTRETYAASNALPLPSTSLYYRFRCDILLKRLYFTSTVHIHISH